RAGSSSGWTAPGAPRWAPFRGPATSPSRRSRRPSAASAPRWPIRRSPSDARATWWEASARSGRRPGTRRCSTRPPNCGMSSTSRAGGAASTWGSRPPTSSGRRARWSPTSRGDAGFETRRFATLLNQLSGRPVEVVEERPAKPDASRNRRRAKHPLLRHRDQAELRIRGEKRMPWHDAHGVAERSRAGEAHGARVDGGPPEFVALERERHCGGLAQLLAGPRAAVHELHGDVVGGEVAELHESAHMQLL